MNVVLDYKNIATTPSKETECLVPVRNGYIRTNVTLVRNQTLWRSSVKSHLSDPPPSRLCSRSTHSASQILRTAAFYFTGSLTIVVNKARVLEERHRRTEASHRDICSVLCCSCCSSWPSTSCFLRWCHFLSRLRLLDTSRLSDIASGQTVVQWTVCSPLSF